MTYLAIGGAGLAVGLSLMIWALTERSKRGRAERLCAAAERRVEQYAAIARTNGEHAADVEKQNHRARVENGHLRHALKDAVSRLRNCRDPKALSDWLRKELEFDWSE